MPKNPQTLHRPAYSHLHPGLDAESLLSVGSDRFRETLSAILWSDKRSPRTTFSANRSAERCWSGRTGLTANQFHLKRVTGVRIPASPPYSKTPINIVYLTCCYITAGENINGYVKMSPCETGDIYIEPGRTSASSGDCILRKGGTWRGRSRLLGRAPQTQVQIQFLHARRAHALQFL